MSQPGVASIKSANGPEDYCLNILSSVSLSDKEKLSLVIGNSQITFKKHTVCFLSPWISDILKEEYSCLRDQVFISLPEEASMGGFQSLKAIIETGVAQNLSNGDKEELSAAIHLLGMDIRLNEVVRQNIDHESNAEDREVLQESANDNKESFIKTETVEIDEHLIKSDYCRVQNEESDSNYGSESDPLGSENNRNEENSSGTVRESSEGGDCRDTKNIFFNQSPDLICFNQSLDQYAQEDVLSNIEDGQDDGETISFQFGNNQSNLIEDLNDESDIEFQVQSIQETVVKTLSSDEIFSEELKSKRNSKKSIVKISFVSEPKLLIKDYVRKSNETTPIIDEQFLESDDDLFNKSDNVEECPICERRQCISCSVYGASACNNCRLFFLRTVRRERLELKLERCQSSTSNSCSLKKEMACMPCRYDKCLSVGMKKHLVKTDQEIKDKYFINGAAEKVTRGPKEARSWNQLKKSLGKIKPKETTKENKKTREEGSDCGRREKRSRDRDNEAPRKKQKKEQNERQPKKDSSATEKNPRLRGKGKRRDEDKG